MIINYDNFTRENYRLRMVILFRHERNLVFPSTNVLFSRNCDNVPVQHQNGRVDPDQFPQQSEPG